MKAPRVFVIEDDISIAELERDYLEAAGFKIDMETHGARALALIREGAEHDLYIVDLMLPGSDGFTLCREIRSLREAPILVVSARSSDIDKVRLLGIGVDDYVTKPFSPAELVARAKAHLERYKRLRGEQGGLIAARGMTIDTVKKSLSIEQRPVQLTATEYAILVLLAQSPGRIFSKEEIFERVKGEGSFGEASTVTVHIRRLREKIEADPAKPAYVETVWGMGYRFVL